MKVINFLYTVLFVMLLLVVLNYTFFSLGIDIKKDIVNILTDLIK